MNSPSRHGPRFWFSMALVLVSPLTTFAANPKWDEAIQLVRRDVEDATAALIRERETIAAARIPLAAEWEDLQRAVSALRADVQRRRALRRQDEHQREAREDQWRRVDNEYRYLLAAALEYRRSLETRLSESERLAWRDDLAALDAEWISEETPERLPGAVADLLAGGLRRMEARMGGHVFGGHVLDERGLEWSGRIAVLGPLAYFASEDGRRAGLVVTRFGSAFPALEEGPVAGAAGAIASLVAGEEAVVPVDITGDALKVMKARVSWTEELRRGGMVIVPLALVGVLAALLALWKGWDLSRLRRRDDETWREMMRLIREEKVQEARNLAAAAAEPLKGLFTEAIACRLAAREQLEEILHEHIVSFLPRLERHLGTLAVLGGIAPLLGLLGTVTGMIHTFQLVTLFGSGDAKLLSGGISEALITTKYGLMIAVPVLLVHAFLARRARGHLAELEQTALGMVNDLKGRPSA